MTASIRVRTVIPCGAKTVIGNKIKKAILQRYGNGTHENTENLIDSIFLLIKFAIEFMEKYHQSIYLRFQSIFYGPKKHKNMCF